MSNQELQLKVICSNSNLIQINTYINIFELIIVSINLSLLPLFVHVASKLTLHLNLKCIIGLLCYNYVLYLANRIFILAVHLDILVVPGDSKKTVGIIYNFIDVYFFQIYLYSQFSVCFERYAATWHLRDYETNKRGYISRISIILTSSLSLIGAFIYIFVSGLSIKIVITCVALANSCIGVTLMFKLEHRNKRLLAQFSASRKKLEIPYSLSFRYQVDENIRSTQLIRNVFLLFGIANVLFAPVYVATMKDEEPGSQCWQKLMEAILHVMIVISATEVPFVALCSHKQYRDLAKNMPLFGYFYRLMKKGTAVCKGDEGNVYFKNLSQQWK